MSPSESVSAPLLARVRAQRTAADIGRLRWYALVDAAQDHRLPEVLRAPRSACLLGNNASISEASPHLVTLPDAPRDHAWHWIERHATEKPCVVLLASVLDFDALFEHLQKFLEVQVNRRTTMLLAWWDSAILASLIGQPDDSILYVKGPIFHVEQRDAFVEPIQGINYWDRAGHLREVDTSHLNESVLADPMDGDEPVLPLKLDHVQIRQLVKAATPDQVLYELRLNRPGVLESRDDLENYLLTCRLVDVAEENGISGLRDLVNFVGTGMILGEGFHEYPAIARRLEDVRNGQQTFTDMLAELPAEALEHDGPAAVHS